MKDTDSIYVISFVVINTEIDKGVGTKFDYQKVIQEIKRRGGILRVSPGVTIKDYLGNLCEIGILNRTAEPYIYEVVSSNIDGAKEYTLKRNEKSVFHTEN